MQKIATLSAVRADRGLLVEIGPKDSAEKILLVRDGGAIRAYSAVCPHAGGPLDQGAVCNGHIVCPWHKGTFRVSDGTLVEPPPLDSLARYPVEVDGQDILVSPEKLSPAVPREGDDQRVVLIAGAGAAGTAAASALREFGFAGRIQLVGREPGEPFDRTSLSKFVMSGQMKPDEVPPLRPAEFYRDEGIERIEAEIRRLDVTARTVALRDGRVLKFDAAVIATGGVPKSIDIPGVNLRGVHLLRTRQDAAAILGDVRKGGRVVILGSSFIGLEVASGLRDQDVAVTVVSPEKIPFSRQFGDRIGQSFRKLHEAHQVRFVLGGQAARIDGSERAEAVVLEDGQRLAADLVVIGVGVRPATDFVEGVERGEDGGLAVDSAMRIAESVYVAGDIASFPLPHDGSRVRVEHWRVAQQHARIAARNIAGGQATYDGVPFFWTYHYGKRFEYLGHAENWDEVIIDGDLDRQNFVAFLVQGDHVGAILACERERATAILAERMRAPLAVGTAMDVIRTT